MARKNRPCVAKPHAIAQRIANIQIVMTNAIANAAVRSFTRNPVRSKRAWVDFARLNVGFQQSRMPAFASDAVSVSIVVGLVLPLLAVDGFVREIVDESNTFSASASDAARNFS
jgi:hypothetical protein